MLQTCNRCRLSGNATVNRFLFYWLPILQYVIGGGYWILLIKLFFTTNPVWCHNNLISPSGYGGSTASGNSNDDHKVFKWSALQSALLNALRGAQKTSLSNIFKMIKYWNLNSLLWFGCSNMSFPSVKETYVKFNSSMGDEKVKNWLKEPFPFFQFSIPWPRLCDPVDSKNFNSLQSNKA